MQIIITFGKSHEQQSCKRKVRYGHEQTAEKAKIRMEAKLNKKLDIYECEYCHGWHLGTSWQE